MATAN